MTNIQLGSGSASSKTHHLTQPSETLNRRYVERPSNFAIEEAARSVHSRPDSHTSSHPSRLVNLKVRATDLAQLQEQPEITEPAQNYDTVVPKVVEYGAEEVNSLALSQIVPPEENPVEEPQTSCYDTSVVIDSDHNDTHVVTTTAVTTAGAFNSQELAMNIAADYAAASMGVSSHEQAATMDNTSDNSIDTIARAASEAIAAIRTANDPEEIAEQVTALQSFAENLRANSGTPEMLELSETIETFVSVAMKSSRVQEELEKKQSQQKTEESLPVVTIQNPNKAVAKVAPKKVAKPVVSRSKVAKVARPAMRRAPKATPKVAPKLVADEDQALRKALRSVAAMDGEDTNDLPLKKQVRKKKSSGKRLALAFFCAVICVGLVVYFVGSSIPDISVKVAAMQTGIEASYPSYVPRDFSLRDINSEDGKITLTFNGPEKAEFVITEEKSSWDSNTLLRNYVEPSWQSNYITTHEQGITIYISGSNAAWVNGGVMYKITASGNTLTKKQLRNIVTSM